MVESRYELADPRGLSSLRRWPLDVPDTAVKGGVFKVFQRDDFHVAVIFRGSLSTELRSRTSLHLAPIHLISWALNRKDTASLPGHKPIHMIPHHTLPFLPNDRSIPFVPRHPVLVRNLLSSS